MLKKHLSPSSLPGTGAFLIKFYLSGGRWGRSFCFCPLIFKNSSLPVSVPPRLFGKITVYFTVSGKKGRFLITCVEM